LVLWEHGVGVGLAFGGVGGGDGVNDRLGFFVADLLVIVYDVAQVVAAAVVGFPHAHRIVREVDIAVVAKELRHFRFLSVIEAHKEKVVRRAMSSGLILIGVG
jgi:hypothetical protein